MMDSRETLPVMEQNRIRFALLSLVEDAPKSEVFFFNNCSTLIGGTLLVVNAIYWRTCYRTFNLHKYGRDRVLSLLTAMTGSIPPWMWQKAMVEDKLTAPYRDESRWSYARNSFIFHQYGLITCLSGSLAGTLIFAHANACIPLASDLLSRQKILETTKYIVNALRPKCKTLAIAGVASSFVVSFIGARAYDESCYMLAKMNRKTLVFRED